MDEPANIISGNSPGIPNVSDVSDVLKTINAGGKNTTTPIGNQADSLSSKSVIPSSIMSAIFKGFMVIFLIFIVLVILTIISQYSKVKANAKNIAKDWPKYRCQPHVMPFAGWLVGPPGTSGTENFVECGLLVFKNSFDRFMAPFVEFLDQLLQVVLDMFRSIENVRKMINYLRDSIRNFLEDIGNMLYGYGKKLSYLFNRLLQTFKLMFDTLYYLFYTVAFSIYTVAAVWNSPIGGVGRFFCFKKDTLIRMNDGTNLPISDVKIGDNILFGGTVLSAMKFIGKNTVMYSYPTKHQNIIVSGEHLVLENKKWIRVSKSKKAIKQNTRENEIYCLSSEKGKIYSNNILFTDFQEAQTNEQFEIIRGVVLSYLNKSIDNTKGKADKVYGIEGSFPVELLDGSSKRIDQLQINDILKSGGVVEGIVDVFGKRVDQYIYKNVICSGDLIVYDNGSWKPVRSCTNTIQVKKDIKLYNLFTSDSFFEGPFMVIDFLQINNNATNEEIDFYVEKYLNKAKI
jgi:hypothetical protein